jgi:hypothetical protein
MIFSIKICIHAGTPTTIPMSHSHAFLAISFSFESQFTVFAIFFRAYKNAETKKADGPPGFRSDHLQKNFHAYSSVYFLPALEYLIRTSQV